MNQNRRRLCFAVALLLLSVAACAPMTSDQPWTETFDDPAAWELSSDAAAEVTLAESQLLIHVLQPGQLAWATTDRIYRDFDLRVEATQVDGPEDNEYGVLVRTQGDDQFYAFSVSGDGFVRAARYNKGIWTLLGSDWTPHEAVNQGEATNELEIQARGPSFTLLVNGTEVLTVEDDALNRGGVGLYAGAFEVPGVRITFDNLELEPAP